MANSSLKKRSYDDACAAAHALDLVGERWALLIVRELVLGPKRFTDLRTSLPGISPNVLTQRLEELERGSILQRRKLPPPAAAWVYELTEWGKELEPVILAIGRWGARSPSLPQGAAISTDGLILSFRAMFNAEASEGLAASIALHLGDDRFRMTISNNAMHVERGELDTADAVIETDANTLAAVVYGGLKLTDATREGRIKVFGDKAVIKHLLLLFPLPKPAAENPRWPRARR